MILYDISRGLFSSPVYGGDPEPQMQLLKSHQKGDRYDLSQITLCTHTGTHIDAPRHFLEDGATIE
ncbi:MAG: cyclase family protein, partial [Oscillospiraceae bacterium]|nr:cyclase family protein [Oscillospiraceae bacterium]